MSNDAVPEADALEQSEPLREPDDRVSPTGLGDEVPEADAWEQSLPVPMDDEEDRR
ncbi:MAG TPA: hypothetical protein VFA46_01475 [Actinomycetes bacterium]|nr:hypothetical protein [Actinomycetes bacterium]